MAKLDKEFEFYRKNKEALLSKYENKFIAIVGHDVVGAYDDEMEAVRTTMKEIQTRNFSRPKSHKRRRSRSILFPFIF